MSNLIIEIMLASAHNMNLISEVRVFPTYAIIRKGNAEVGKDFDIAKECFHRGECVGGGDFFAR